MFRKLLPHNEDFFLFFNESASLVVEGAKHLLGFWDESNDPKEVFQKIKSCEVRADDVAHQCIEALHKTFITPFDRTDIYKLISTLDDIIDEIEDVSKYIVLYNLQDIGRNALELAKLVLAGTEAVKSAVQELRLMKNTSALRAYFFEINQLENQADALLIQSLSHLFETEKNPLNILKYKEIYEHLESATDICEDVGNILEGIVLENE